MSAPQSSSMLQLRPAETVAGQCRLSCPYETTYMGSWHVARLDFVRMIVSELQDALAHPGRWEPALSFEQARSNAHISWLLVALGLLAGVRPFELMRIHWSSFDINGAWVSLRGKPHAGRTAFRRIPLLPELIPHIEVAIRDHPVKRGRRRPGLFNPEGEFIVLTTKKLNGILTKAANLGGMDQAPDFYSLRHRFRTDMLSLKLPEHMLTFLMGHESRGIESCNIYLERGLHDLVPVYRDGARRLAGQYGIRLEPADAVADWK